MRVCLIVPEGPGVLAIDLNSHANTFILDNNALLVESPYPKQTAIVSFADPLLGTVTKPILSGAFKYTKPYDGTSYILVVHPAIHINTMHHSLYTPCNLGEMISFLTNVLRA